MMFRSCNQLKIALVVFVKDSKERITSNVTSKSFPVRGHRSCQFSPEEWIAMEGALEQLLCFCDIYSHTG